MGMFAAREAGPGCGVRGPRRGSAGGAAALRDRALQLAIEMTHRASMPGIHFFIHTKIFSDINMKAYLEISTL